MLAAEQAAQLGLRPLSARCELALGRLYEQKHDQSAATAKFGTARTMMEEMGMTGWLTSFERASLRLRELLATSARSGHGPQLLVHRRLDRGADVLMDQARGRRQIPLLERGPPRLSRA
jgi:hypothetical protein